MFSMFLYTVPAVVVGQFVYAIKLFCYFLLFNYCFVLFICRVFLPSLYYRISAPRTSGPAQTHSATSPIEQNLLLLSGPAHATSPTEQNLLLLSLYVL